MANSDGAWAYLIPSRDHSQESMRICAQDFPSIIPPRATLTTYGSAPTSHSPHVFSVDKEGPPSKLVEYPNSLCPECGQCGNLCIR